MSKKNKTNKSGAVAQHQTEQAAAEPTTIETPATPTEAVVVTAPVDQSPVAATQVVAHLDYSRLIQQVEALWDYINDKHFAGTLKTRPIITIASRGNRSSFAWFKADAWKTAEGTRHEINIAAETFARPRQDTYATLVHTMVYQALVEKDIKGVNTIGYHNRNFLKVATDAFLECHKNGIKGFSQTSLNPQGLAIFTAYTGELDTHIHREVAKANYKPMVMVPATTNARDFMKTESAARKITMKELLDEMVIAYSTSRQVTIEVTAAPATLPPVETPEMVSADSAM